MRQCCCIYKSNPNKMEREMQIKLTSNICTFFPVIRFPTSTFYMYTEYHVYYQQQNYRLTHKVPFLECIYICNTKLEKPILFCIMWDKQKAVLIGYFYVLLLSVHSYMHIRKALLNLISKSKYCIVHMICTHIPHGHYHLLVLLTIDTSKP